LVTLTAGLIALTTLTTITLAGLSLGLDLGARHQTQLPIGYYLLARFQSVFDHGHRVGDRAGLNDSHLGGRVKLHPVHDRLVLADLDGLRWNHDGCVLDSEREHDIYKLAGIKTAVVILKRSFQPHGS